MATSPRAAYQLSLSASHLLHRAQQMADDRFVQVAGTKTTPRQFAVLAAIAENPGRSQTDLVAATGIDRSTLADMIDRMEGRNWIIRVTSKSDARAKAVTLAAPGRAAFAACVAAARAADEAVLDALPRTERKAFLDALAKLAQAAASSKVVARPSKTPARKPPKPAKPAKKGKGGKKKGKRGR